MNRKKIQADFIPFDRLYYIQKTNENHRDIFFEATKELGIKEPLKYQMSFTEYKNVYHCFLTELTHIGKIGFCYPQPLIFKALINEKLINEKNFCVVLFDENFSLLCVYHNGELSRVKNIPTFTLSTLNSKDEQRFGEILKQARIIELLEHQQTELLLSFNDTFEFAEFLSKQMGLECKKLEEILGENALKELSQKSTKYLDSNANFIKKYKKSLPLSLKLTILFVLCFCLTLFLLIMLDLPQYRQNKIVKAENENLYNELLLLEQTTQNLNKELKDLNHSFSTNAVLLEQNIQIFSAILNILKPNQNKSLILHKLFALLNANKLTISLLKLENSRIELLFSTKESWENAFKLFSHNADFKLLEHKEDSYTLILGYQNE